MSLPIDPTNADPRRLAWDAETLYEIIKNYGYHLRDSRLSSFGEGYNYWALMLDTDTITATKKGHFEYDSGWAVCAGILINSEGKIIGIDAYDYYYNNSTNRFIRDSYIVALRPGVKVVIKYYGADVWRDRSFILHRDEREKEKEVELPTLPSEWVPVFKEIIEIWRESIGWIKKTSRGYFVNWESLNEL